MTELQIGLIGLGAVAISGVVVYNTWLEYRHRKLAQRLLRPSQDDVLLGTSEVDGAAEFSEPQPFSQPSAFTEPGDASASAWEEEEADLGETIEPPPVMLEEPCAEPKPHGASLYQRVEPVLSPEVFPSERVEPVLPTEDTAIAPPAPIVAPAVASPRVRNETPAPVVAPPPVPPLAPPSVPRAEREAPVVRETTAPIPEPSGDEYREIAEPQHLLSAAIDYIAAFEAIEPALAGQILDAQRAALAGLRKPIHWFGYNEVTREWEAVEATIGIEYRSLRVGLQLVDRRGPVAESDLTAFHVAMHDLAHTLMAIVDMPHRQTAVETAATLDEFCAGVDIQIGINVISAASPFAGTKIRALAEAAGMLIDDSGRFVRADDDGNILYVLLNQEAAGFAGEAMKSLTTHGLTFLLDVPTVAHGDRVFSQMVDLAKRFADVLKGVLVDDNRRPLPDGALEPIRRQIVQYQSTMAARKLPAGSSLTKRLFS